MQDTTSLASLVEIAQIVGGLGSTGLLALGIYLFIKGVVVPQSSVDKMREHADIQTKLFAKELGDDIVKGMETSTRNAIITAVKEINNKKGGG